MAPPSKDVMRIFISTDNHLGHAEDNEMRQDDSFLAMEEVFQRATGCEVLAKRDKEQSLTLLQTTQADFLLLGGDLFDKNKPSRNTMVKSMKMFKKYCLGERFTMFGVRNPYEN